MPDINISNLQVPPTTTMPAHVASADPHPQYAKIDALASIIKNTVAMKDLKDVVIDGPQDNNTVLVYNGQTYSPVNMIELGSLITIPIATSERPGIARFACSIWETDSCIVMPRQVIEYVAANAYELTSATDTQLGGITLNTVSSIANLVVQDNAFTLTYATENRMGGVELATTAQALEGVDTSKVITPANLKAAINSIPMAHTSASIYVPGLVKTVETNNPNGRSKVVDLINENWSRAKTGSTSTYETIAEYVPQIEYNQFVNVRVADYNAAYGAEKYYKTHVGPIGIDIDAESSARELTMPVYYTVYSNGVLSARYASGTSHYGNVNIAVREYGAAYDINTNGFMTVYQEGIIKRLTVGNSCYVAIHGEAHNVLVSASVPVPGAYGVLQVANHGHATYCTITGYGHVHVGASWTEEGQRENHGTWVHGGIDIRHDGIRYKDADGYLYHSDGTRYYTGTAENPQYPKFGSAYYRNENGEIVVDTDFDADGFKSLDHVIFRDTSQICHYGGPIDDAIIENVIVSNIGTAGSNYQGLNVYATGKAFNVVLTDHAGAVISGYAKDVIVHRGCCLWTGPETRIDNIAVFGEVKVTKGAKIEGCVVYPGGVLTGSGANDVVYNTIHEPDHIIKPVYKLCQYYSQYTSSVITSHGDPANGIPDTTSDVIESEYTGGNWYITSTSAIGNIPSFTALLYGPDTLVQRQTLLLNGDVSTTEAIPIGNPVIGVWATTPPRFFIRSDTTKFSAMKNASDWGEYGRLSRDATIFYPATIIDKGNGYSVIPDFGPDVYHEMWSPSGNGNALVKRYATTSSGLVNIYTSKVSIGDNQTSLVIVHIGDNADTSTYTSYSVETLNVELGRYGVFSTCVSTANTISPAPAFHVQIQSKMFAELTAANTSIVWRIGF